MMILNSGYNIGSVARIFSGPNIDRNRFKADNVKVDNFKVDNVKVDNSKVNKVQS